MPPVLEASSQESHSGSWSRGRLVGGLLVLKKELLFLWAAPALLAAVYLCVYICVCGKEGVGGRGWYKLRGPGSSEIGGGVEIIIIDFYWEEKAFRKWGDFCGIAEKLIGENWFTQVGSDTSSPISLCSCCFPLLDNPFFWSFQAWVISLCRFRHQSLVLKETGSVLQRSASGHPSTHISRSLPC